MDDASALAGGGAIWLRLVGLLLGYKEDACCLMSIPVSWERNN